MSIEKVHEIFKSLGVIDVSYNEHQVWIENINEETNEVGVRDLRTDKKFVVNASELKSHEE